MGVKRRKKSPAAALRPFWILFTLLVALAGAGGYYAASWPGFRPHDVTVSGNRIVPAQEILRRAAISPDSNVWLQGMKAAADRVAAIPYIANATVRRSLPARVRIVVSERVPLAYVRSGDESALVDGDLRVLENGPVRKDRPVFIVSPGLTLEPGAFLKSEAVRHLRDDYAQLLSAHVVAGSLQYDRFGELVAVMRGGVRLLLGDDGDLQQKTPLIDPILSQVASNGRKLAAVDLRAPKTPVVVYSTK